MPWFGERKTVLDKNICILEKYIYLGNQVLKLRPIFTFTYKFFQCLNSQNCPEEISNEGISVTWHETSSANNIESDPLCYLNDNLITRNCSNSSWIPSIDEIGPCLKVVKYFDLNSCPPGYYKISENSKDYCYQIGESVPWNYPCFASGGASVITDFTAAEIEHLLKTLIATNTSRYFWLPAQRQRLFNPVVWTIPGPNWGQRVLSSNFLRLCATFSKNCLLLDVEQGVLITESCSKNYPSLCFYMNDIHYPTRCPNGYHSFRFKPDNGTCYGIEKSDQGMSFNDFLDEKCKKPMFNSKYDLTRFIFKKISELNNLPNNVWCWLRAPPNKKSNNDTEYIRNNNSLEITGSSYLEGIINNAGVLSLLNSSALLSCMACEVEVINGQTEFMFEYNDIQNIIYLTVYYPSGLWKYDNNDKGIQCFSDAKGFVSVVDVNDIPLFDIKSTQKDGMDLGHVEKIVYAIDLVTDSSGQYWCEGHTVNFSFIATDKIIANPKGNKVHVFSLVIKYYILPDEVEDIANLTDLVNNVTNIYLAKKVLLMDIIDYSLDHMMILLHLHIAIEDDYEDEARNIQATFDTLKQKSELELPKYNYTFVNISSSVYCLPTTSIDVITLDWEMTLIGHISAPKQFCLQVNGLPVKRHCRGSYMLGGFWGEVEGHCDNTYEPSKTTTFLYNFVKTQIPNNYSSRFLTDGLNFVLGDTDIIIPADIYYLSVSLQQILDLAQENVSSIDIGDIENIAWVMDRMMILDFKYLHLAQTLNSTNVILDSVSDIIEIIAQKNLNESTELSDVAYEIAIQPQFVVLITYPQYNNITGIAIVKDTASFNFTDMSIRPLYKNTSLEEVLSIKNLEIATWLPEEMLDTMQINSNDTEENTTNIENFHIIITIFHNDAIFQELTTNKHVINSRIIGVSIPDYSSNLEYPIPLIFKQINQTTNYFCGYWDFQPQQPNHIPGSWKKQGCFIVKIINDTTVCECYHLTHFGQLLTIPDNPNNEEFSIIKNHTRALNIITLVGSFLSLLGIIGIWITALVFGNWRKKAGTKVLLQLSTAIALPLVFILVFNLDYTMFKQVNGMYVIVDHMKPACIVLGSLLHFSILASFMWMLITAILQFIRYVRVLGVRRPARFMFKFTLIGWGIPLLPVITTLALDAENYIPSSSIIKKICYPNGYYLIAGVLLPICIILLINITLFILVLHAISRGPDQKMKSTDMDLVGAQLRVSIFLFFLLGLTWIFGIFSFSNNLLWSYLFCLTSTLQGFVLFIYFVICDPKTRNLWISLMKPQFVSNSSRNSITSITNG